MKKNMYKHPSKSIKKYSKNPLSKSNNFKETRKELKDKKIRYAQTHPRKSKRVINKCMKCKDNEMGFCKKHNRACYVINDLCFQNKI